MEELPSTSSTPVDPSRPLSPSQVKYAESVEFDEKKSAPKSITVEEGSSQVCVIS